MLRHGARAWAPVTIDESKMLSRFDELGPVPRLCIDPLLCPASLQRYRSDVQNAVQYLTVNELEKLRWDTSMLKVDDVSRKIFLARREDRDDVNSKVVVAPITVEFIWSRLANQFRTVGPAEKVRLFKTLARDLSKDS